MLDLGNYAMRRRYKRAGAVPDGVDGDGVVVAVPQKRMGGRAGNLKGGRPGRRVDECGNSSVRWKKGELRPRYGVWSQSWTGLESSLAGHVDPGVQYTKGGIGSGMY